MRIANVRRTDWPVECIHPLPLPNHTPVLPHGAISLGSFKVIYMLGRRSVHNPNQSYERLENKVYLKTATSLRLKNYTIELSIKYRIDHTKYRVG